MFFRRQLKRKLQSSLSDMERMESPTRRKAVFGKASAHTSPKGSLTVECAFILPLFFLGMATIISFMDLYPLQTKQLLTLCDQAKEAGIYAYLEGEKEEITLPAVSVYQSPVSVIPLPQIWLRNKVTVHTWVGSDGNNTNGGGKPAEMVYVTEHGSVYHRDASCHHLDLSIRQIGEGQLTHLRNKNGEKYYPCELCEKAGGGSSGLVYITDTGNRYHSQAGCSGLKRTVRLEKKDEVSHLSPCKNCGGS